MSCFNIYKIRKTSIVVGWTFQTISLNVNWYHIYLKILGRFKPKPIYVWMEKTHKKCLHDLESHLIATKFPPHLTQQSNPHKHIDTLISSTTWWVDSSAFQLIRSQMRLISLSRTHRILMLYIFNRKKTTEKFFGSKYNSYTPSHFWDARSFLSLFEWIFSHEFSSYYFWDFLVLFYFRFLCIPWAHPHSH